MSPNNPIANWDQISVWSIPSVPGANTEMYFVIILLYLLHFWHPMWGSGDHLWTLGIIDI